MKRLRWRHPIAALLPVIIALLAFGALPAMNLAAQSGPNPNTSNCEPNLLSSVAPEQLNLGDTAHVQLTMNMSCPDYKLPIDIIFLVDVSNSMTRASAAGTGADATSVSGGVAPTAKAPPPGSSPMPPPNPPVPPVLPLQVSPPVKTAEPVLPPNVPVPGNSSTGRSSDPAGCEQPGSSTSPPGGGITQPTLPTVSKPTAKSPGSQTPGKPVATSQVPMTKTPIGSGAKTPVAGTPPNASNSPQQPTEPAGTEDLIRDAKTFIRDFVDQPQIQKDLADGTLRLGLVAFNDRGRRLVSLSGEGKRVTGRLSLLRGSGRTRVDLGMRTAESALLERNNARRVFNDADHTKVIIMISDGGFCARDLRVKVDKRIEVVTLAAGRGPYAQLLRQMASEPEYALKLNAKAIKESMFLYGKDFTRFRPVTVPSLELNVELEPAMQLVGGTIAPNAAVDAQKVRWTAPDIDWTKPVTLTYDIRPQAGGLQNINAIAQAVWKDSEKRDGLGVFPAIFVDVTGPTATSTPEVMATATPELR
ncbi:MAG: VWA domain-containing protein [Ardenticatenales bacterium]